MFHRGKYVDSGDGREMSLKRQRLIDQGSSFYATSQGTSLMYNPPPPAYTYTGHPLGFPVVRLRGLPVDCIEADVADFFRGLDIVDILFLHRGGKFMGEAFCVLGYPLQIDFALQKNMQSIGGRYVEVYMSKRHDYYKAIASEFSDGKSLQRAKSFDEGKDLAAHTGILRLRGLPYSANKKEILDFFKKFSLSEDSIHITLNFEGRASGEAFVEFASAEDSKAAMEKDRMKLRSRYIELFPASCEDLEEAISRGQYSPKPPESTEMTSVLRMRGLPYSSGKDDIIEFFKEFTLSEDSIHIMNNWEGRPTGEAFVEFGSSEDAKRGLAKDRMTLGSRYIELFPSSLEDLNQTISRQH